MEIKLYSKPSCIQCTATARELERRGIAFSVIDLTRDIKAYDMVRSLGYMQAPVVMVGEDHWSGFRPDKISAIAESWVGSGAVEYMKA